MRTDDILQIPTDTLLAEELADEDVVEMANLTTAQTDVPGGNSRASIARARAKINTIMAKVISRNYGNLADYQQQGKAIGVGLPRSNDGSLLFLQHMPSNRGGPCGRLPPA